MLNGRQCTRIVYGICQTALVGLALVLTGQLFGGLGVAMLVTCLVAFAIWRIASRVDTTVWRAEFHFGMPPPEAFSSEEEPLTPEEEQQFDELVRHFHDD